MAQICRACQRTDFYIISMTSKFKIGSTHRSPGQSQGFGFSLKREKGADMVELIPGDLTKVSKIPPQTIQGDLLAAALAYSTVGNGFPFSDPVPTVKMGFIWMGLFSYHCSTRSNSAFQRCTSEVSPSSLGERYCDDMLGRDIVESRPKRTQSVCAAR